MSQLDLKTGVALSILGVALRVDENSASPLHATDCTYTNYVEPHTHRYVHKLLILLMANNDVEASINDRSRKIMKGRKVK